ncbi:sigma factor-like helix-turn-helix DNA-binding protein [Streptosporangium sp. NPDC051022]|uniref:sigma factor-like helix-turn-helix DNA-binding protein n=1 Tax=Streptosporangium sp. NPDC051022 TaxID=3155752 RepID=UPI00343CCA80
MNSALRVVAVPTADALLERLTPAERAVFVLREAFSYGYREIADVLDLSEAGCRQLHRDGSRRIGGPRVFEEPGVRRRWNVDGFMLAAMEGDLAALERILDADVVAWTDGGEEAAPMVGAREVARYAVRVLARFGEAAEMRHTEVNGQTALIARVDGRLVGVIVMEIVEDRITALWSVLNPTRLADVTRRTPGAE